MKNALCTLAVLVLSAIAFAAPASQPKPVPQPVPQPLTLTVQVIDISRDPPVPVSGVDMAVQIGTDIYLASTNANGEAVFSKKAEAGDPVTIFVKSDEDWLVYRQPPPFTMPAGNVTVIVSVIPTPP